MRLFLFILFFKNEKVQHWFVFQIQSHFQAFFKKAITIFELLFHECYLKFFFSDMTETRNCFFFLFHVNQLLENRKCVKKALQERKKTNRCYFEDFLTVKSIFLFVCIITSTLTNIFVDISLFTLFEHENCLRFHLLFLLFPLDLTQYLFGEHFRW